ncbi:hypothetical protein ACM53I_000489 [Enterobacter hormaechei]|nr:hypothetical protein [Klebsiella quasipneumoniae]HBT6125834.1 hypothetical protein [Klebsiella quasipneumoniae]HBT6220781.1 hypothetical protein [Klebsiella quasipneumoniae]HBT6242633.1 hypothetical protein [Klebsiella quasipneumoniae]HDN2662788.1 hypothetical protein [Enterobacter hormaechei]
MQLLPTMALTIMWPPAQASIVMAIYLAEIEASIDKRNDAIATIAQTIVIVLTP